MRIGKRAGSASGRPQIARTSCSNWVTAGLDGPVAGVVRARRQFVDQEPLVGGHEHLDREDADQLERAAISRRRPALSASAGGTAPARGSRPGCGAVAVLDRRVADWGRPGRARRSPRSPCGSRPGPLPIARARGRICSQAAPGRRSALTTGPCRRSPGGALFRTRGPPSSRSSRATASGPPNWTKRVVGTPTGEEILLAQPVLADLQHLRPRPQRPAVGHRARAPWARSRTRR